ncbi:MAG TPA: hypothetical protein PLJ93_02390 [Candidatus Mcinerneyibacteriales bacterium]|nr:hypothetical protein [Candidatus Mcinerneyibacteriales bacterium]
MNMKESENKGTMHKVWDKVKKFSSEAYEKGREYTAIAELKIKISSLNKEKNNLFTEMGESLYDLISRKEEDICSRTEIRARFEKINVINEKINNLEFDINRIKEEHNINDADLKRMAEEEEKAKEKEKEAARKEKEEKKDAEEKTKKKSAASDKTSSSSSGSRKSGTTSSKSTKKSEGAS